MHTFRVALAQINTTVGDLEGNAAKAVESIERAKEAGADLVAFPELTTTGYPPEDLLFKQQFIQGNLDALDRIVAAARGITAVIGFVEAGEDTYNAAAVARDGVRGRRLPQDVPAQLQRLRRGALFSCRQRGPGLHHLAGP